MFADYHVNECRSGQYIEIASNRTYFGRRTSKSMQYDGIVNE